MAQKSDDLAPERTKTQEIAPSIHSGPLKTDSEELGIHQTKSLQKEVSLPREILVVGLISLAQLTTQIGLGQALSILHVIGDHFGEQDGGLAWLIAGYSLTVGTFILFSGRLGDLFGWKRMLTIGYVWYGIWSIVAGLAWYSNSVLFIFARIFQGVGPAICLPNSLALLGALYQPGMRKNLAFAVFGATAPGGAVMGAVFAALWSLTWWPCKSFTTGAFMSFGVGLFAIAIVSNLAIPDPQDEKPGLTSRSLVGKMQDIDLFGAAAGITGLILFNFAWNQAPLVGWSSPYVITALIVGFLLIPLFLWIELHAPNPLVPKELATADNGFVLACIACGWASFGIFVFYLWQILEVLRGISPLLASAYTAPIAVAGAFASVSTGLALSTLHPSWVLLIAMCAFFVGTTLVATLPVYQVYWAQTFVCTLIAPFGMDMSFPSATVVMSNSVSKARQGVAASLVNTIVNYSISLGLGFAGTVEVHTNNGGATLEDVLLGYRGALYMGMGLSGLGILVALTFVCKTMISQRRNVSKEG